LQTAKDLKRVYKEKTELLNGQLAGEQKLQAERIGILNDQINNYKNQLSELSGKSSVNWTIVIVAVIFGLIIGYLLRGQ
jgi:exodeoxyribonuclease VII large subunit